MKLSLVIPAHNEEGCIEETVRAHHDALGHAGIDHEILVVNDCSQDSTETILNRLSHEDSCIRYVNNLPPNGFGLAVRKGLNNYTGDIVAIFFF